MSRRNPILGAVVVLAIGAVLSLTPAKALTNCTVSPAEIANDAEEQDLLSRVNQYRQTNLLPPLSVDTSLNRAAAWMSRDMADNNRFPADHVDSLGRSLGIRLTQCDVSFTTAGENIAAGNATGAATFEQWRNSPPHNANMLDPDFTRAGVGRAFNGGSTFGWYWTLDLAGGAVTPTSTTPTTASPTTTSPTTTSPTTTSPTTTSPTTTSPSTTLVPPTVVPPTTVRPTIPPIPTFPTTTAPTTVPPTTTSTSTTSTTTVPPSSSVCGQLQEQRAETIEVLDAREARLRASLSGEELEQALARLADARAEALAAFDDELAAQGCV